MEQNKMSNQNHSDSRESNIITKTIASILAAMSITAFSIGGSYLLVTQLQSDSQTTAKIATDEYCGDKDDGDKPGASVNTCGEDKEGGGGNSIGV